MVEKQLSPYRLELHRHNVHWGYDKKTVHNFLIYTKRDGKRFRKEFLQRFNDKVWEILVAPKPKFPNVNNCSFHKSRKYARHSLCYYVDWLRQQTLSIKAKALIMGGINLPGKAQGGWSVEFVLIYKCRR